MLIYFWVLLWGAVLSLSLFNALIMLWLGLTVFLTAERRTWGVWLILGGMLLGSLFFVSHTIILGYELTIFNKQVLDIWWKLGWLPVITAPWLWYAIVLWYAGFGENSGSPMYRRHRLGISGLGAWALCLIGLLLFAHPIPTYQDMYVLYFQAADSFQGVPLLLLFYPPYALFCILAPLDALRRPEPSRRVLGDQARQRSRIWLMASSALLLLIVVLVAVFVLLLIYSAAHRSVFVSSPLFIPLVAAFDLLILVLVAMVCVLLGQAVVAYEVFTGKTLPRRGFQRHWRNALLLCWGVASFSALSMIYQPLPVYSLMVLAGIAVVFYALLSWRSFVHQDALMRQLHPFISSQGLVAQLVQPEDESLSRARQLFSAICATMLNTRQAYLLPWGALASLVSTPLRYPPELPPIDGASFTALRGAGDGLISLNPAEQGGFALALPLGTSEQRMGWLLLGEKADGGLYAQEEVEIARAGAERIVDMLAGEQMARRLMHLQRQRSIQQRVMDLHTRRTLHDEVLPALHLAILQLGSASSPAVRDAIQTLAGTHTQISDLIHNATLNAAGFDPTQSLQVAVENLLSSEFAQAFEGLEWQLDVPLPAMDDLTQEVILHALREVLRNAAIHGRGSNPRRPLHLRLSVVPDPLRLMIVDDGVGYLPGQPSQNGGSGGGLALHSTLLAIVGGQMAIQGGAAGGTEVTITLPTPARLNSG